MQPASDARATQRRVGLCYLLAVACAAGAAATLAVRFRVALLERGDGGASARVAVGARSALGVVAHALIVVGAAKEVVGAAVPAQIN